MKRPDRYARQIAVPGVGELGQRRIESAEVEVQGSGLAAEICALYLAGAGVGTLAVSPELAPAVRALSSEIAVVEEPLDGALVVRPESDGDPLLAGSRAARSILARVLGGDA